MRNDYTIRVSNPRDRIKQLLALAKSSRSPAEARSARKKAGELMKRHGLNRKEVYAPIPQPRSSTPNADMLAHLLQLKAMEEKFAQRERRRQMIVKCVEYAELFTPFVIALIAAVIFILKLAGK